MKKQSGLLIFVLFFFLIFFIWMFIKQYKSINFKLVDNDISDFKKSFTDLWNSGPEMFDNSSITNSVESIKLAIKNGLNQESTSTISNAIQQGIKQQIQESLVEYIYEPWGIKISYFSDLEKSFDEKLKKIIIKYSDVNFLEIKQETFKEKEFNNWLVKNFDIQSLNKETIDNLVFWSTEFKKDDIFNKLYIVNIDKNIFYISYRCEINSQYCEKLEQIAKTFNQIK